MAEGGVMQTFLPYPQFGKSARCLDRRRLGKQRLEAVQLLNAILVEAPGWRSHPATRMWRDHPHSLGLYYSVVCAEWIRRGYQSSMWTPYTESLTLRERPAHWSGLSCFLAEHDWPPVNRISSPPWLRREDLHASHRSNLLRKDPDWYGQWGWTEPPDLPYVWPIEDSA